jgi:hypothetical protein
MRRQHDEVHAGRMRGIRDLLRRQLDVGVGWCDMHVDIAGKPTHRGRCRSGNMQRRFGSGSGWARRRRRTCDERGQDREAHRRRETRPRAPVYIAAMRLLVAALIACACQSDRPPHQVVAHHWVLQFDQSGGDEPGTRSRTLLAADGKFTVTSGTTSTCDVVLPASNIDAISAAIADAKPSLGPSAEHHSGDVNKWNILTIGDDPYAMPTTPAFTAAVDAALKVAADMCPKPH